MNFEKLLTAKLITIALKIQSIVIWRTKISQSGAFHF